MHFPRIRNVVSKLTRLFLCTVFICSCSSSGRKVSSDEQEEEKSIVKAPVVAEGRLLENAKNAYDRGLYTLALQSWTELRDGYPGSFFTTLAELKIADSQFYSSDYASAILSYQEFAKLHPGHEAMPYVKFQIGNSHLAEYRGKKHDQAPLESAVRAYLELLRDYPKSEYSVLGRRRLDHCRELLAEHEAYVADFYFRHGSEEASRSRLQKLLAQFPDTKASADAKKNWNFAASRQSETKGKDTVPAAPLLIDVEEK